MRSQMLLHKTYLDDFNQGNYGKIHLRHGNSVLGDQQETAKGIKVILNNISLSI